MYIKKLVVFLSVQLACQSKQAKVIKQANLSNDLNIEAKAC